MSGSQIAIAATGQTVKAVIQDMQTAQIWNGSSMEVYNSSDWASYNVSMPEQAGSGRYILTIPGGLPAGNYWVTPYLLSNPPTPSLGADTPLDILRLGWNGSAIIEINSGLNVGAINGSVQAAVDLATSSNTFVIGAAAAGTLSGVQMTTNLAPANAFANMYSGRTLLFTSGVNAGLAVLVTGFAVSGGRLTFIAYGNLPAAVAPSVGDTFIIF
jgi:hypothetical protein